jgi:hypothetical protein
VTGNTLLDIRYGNGSLPYRDSVVDIEISVMSTAYSPNMVVEFTTVVDESIRVRTSSSVTSTVSVKYSMNVAMILPDLKGQQKRVCMKEKSIWVCRGPCCSYNYYNRMGIVTFCSFPNKCTPPP